MSSALDASGAAVALMGWTLTVAPLVIKARRGRRLAAEQAEHDRHMEFQARLRKAGEDQAEDPETVRIMHRYAQVAPTTRPVPGGRHRRIPA